MNKNRCYMFCSDAQNCLAENIAHVRCIADMVINRAFAVKGVMELAKQENTCEKVSELLELVAEDVDELIAWAKGLQRGSDESKHRHFKDKPESEE